MTADPGSAVAGGPLGVREEGAGPVLLAVHGMLLGGQVTFGGIAPVWGRHSRVLLVDRPGFEASPGPPVPVGAQADRLLATLQEHSPEVSVDVVACDVGGLVVLRALERAPERFRSLVLIEVPAVGLCPGDMVQPEALLRTARDAHARAATDPLRGSLDLLGVLDPAIAEVAAALQRRGHPGLTPVREDLAWWQAMLDRGALADAVGTGDPTPVLVVSGSTTHPAMRTFGSCAAAALHGRHQVLDGAGHHAHLHQAFGGLLAEFLSTARGA